MTHCIHFMLPRRTQTFHTFCSSDSDQTYHSVTVCSMAPITRSQAKRIKLDVQPDSTKTVQQMCSICLTPPSTIGSTQPCKHDFCLTCIQQWIKNQSTCPLCRVEIREIHHDQQPNGSHQTVAVARKRLQVTYDEDFIIDPAQDENHWIGWIARPSWIEELLNTSFIAETSPSSSTSSTYSAPSPPSSSSTSSDSSANSQRRVQFYRTFDPIRQRRVLRRRQ